MFNICVKLYIIDSIQFYSMRYIFTIAWMLTILQVCITEWVNSSLLQSLSFRYSQLKNYYMVHYENITQVSIDEYIMIFGGQDKDNMKNNALYKIKIDNNNISKAGIFSVEYDIEPKPSERSHGCSIYYNSQMYIFGGIDNNNVVLSDLWSFDTTSAVWRKLATLSSIIYSCKMFIYNDELLIMGTSNQINGTLQIHKFSFLYKSFLYQPIKYFSQFTINNITLWDNTTANTTLRIENLNKVLQDDPNIISSITFTWTNNFPLHQTFCAVQSLKSSFQVFIVTYEAIYKLSLQSYNLTWKKNVDIDADAYFDCSIIPDWLFIVVEQNSTNQLDLRIKYYNISNFNIFGSMSKYDSYDYNEIKSIFVNQTDISKQYQKWPKNVIDFRVFFSFQNYNLYIINNIGISTFILEASCNATEFISSCFYSRVFCKENYTGALCNINLFTSQCPGSISLIDNIEKDILEFQCSGNGICTNNGCVCFEDWTGDDCSIFNRSSICQGDLIMNWPVKNCECQSLTSGGNNCQVVFCYNDCTGSGNCQNTGQCLCESGYEGADCSIDSINFPDPVWQFRATFFLGNILVIFLIIFT